jgi:hypothetical protein
MCLVFLSRLVRILGRRMIRVCTGMLCRKLYLRSWSETVRAFKYARRRQTSENESCLRCGLMLLEFVTVHSVIDPQQLKSWGPHEHPDKPSTAKYAPQGHSEPTYTLQPTGCWFGLMGSENTSNESTPVLTKCPLLVSSQMFIFQTYMQVLHKRVWDQNI